MIEKVKKRIGLFEYDWSMYHFTKDFAIKLAEAGYFVDIFFKDLDISPDYAYTNDFKIFQNIRYYNFSKPATKLQEIKRRYKRLINKIAIHFSIPLNDKPVDMIDHDIFYKTIDIIGTNQYYCFIGIEKKGLIWAGMLSEMYHCPLIYHSLELYIEDNPVMDRVYHFLAAERKYHKLANATIVQDELRANVLLKSNGIEQTNILYFPVSAKRNIIREKSHYLQDKLHIDDHKKIILYFGGINKDRFMTEIIKIAKELDDGVVLVIHGVGPKRHINFLQSIADKTKVIFSNDFIAENEIDDLVSSAHIGIALYKTTNANDRLVAFSSSKVAYYTKCGIPMIAFDTESFRELENSYQCIELINTVNEIPGKVRKILGNYDVYQQQSYCAYERYYSLDNNFSKLINRLEQIIDKVQPAADNDYISSY